QQGNRRGAGPKGQRLVLAGRVGWPRDERRIRRCGLPRDDANGGNVTRVARTAAGLRSSENLPCRRTWRRCRELLAMSEQRRAGGDVHHTLTVFVERKLRLDLSTLDLAFLGLLRLRASEDSVASFSE